jgi:hypothetical protein
MRRTSFAILVLLATALPAQPDERGALTGKWTGKSICTSARPACHDEEALYRITPTDDQAVVSMSMAKVVDGKEVVMGVLPFHVDAKNHLLTAEFQQRDIRALWTFSWSGAHMTGTLKLLPKDDVIRNIDLKKE